MVEYIEEVGRLMNELDITGEHATELINIFFDCIECRTYKQYLTECIHRFNKENISSDKLKAFKEKLDDYGFAYWETDEYLLVSQYDEIQEAMLVPV